MPLSKLRSESIDLTDDYAFTGTVTGAGSNSGFRFIKKVDFTTSSAVVDLTDLFSADYSHYKLMWDIVGSDTSDNDISHSFQFLKASDGTVDNTTDIDYAAHGNDSDGTGRSIYRNNKEFINFMYNTVENAKPAYYEMSVFAPFDAEFTTVNSLQTYMINDNLDVTTSNGAAMRANTTSYSGMRLVLVDTNNSVTPDVSCSATGTLLLYGFAES